MNKVFHKLIMFMVMMAFAAGIRVSAVYADGDFSKATDIKPADSYVELSMEEGGTYVYHLLVNDENPYIINFSAKTCGYADCTIYVNGKVVLTKLGSGFFDKGFTFKPGDKVYFVMENVRRTGKALVRFAEAIYESRVDVKVYGNEDDGGWSYDSVHHVLTLNGFHGEWIGIADLMEADKDAERTDFTIVVEGENVLSKMNSSVNSIQALGVDLTIKGSGTLELLTAGGGTGIHVKGSLTIDGPVISYKGEGCGAVIFDGYNYVGNNAYEDLYKKAGSNGNNIREFFTMKSGIFNIDIIAYYRDSTLQYYRDSAIRAQGSIHLLGGSINVIWRDKNATIKPVSVFDSLCSRTYSEDCVVTVYLPSDMSDIAFANSHVAAEAGMQQDISHGMYEVNGKFNLSQNFKLEKYEFDYTGSAIKPVVIVPEGVSPGVGYYVYYMDNVEPGTGKVVIKGLIDSKFEQMIEFKIVRNENSGGSGSGGFGSKAGDDFPTEVYDVKDLKVGMKIKCPSVNGIYKIIKITKKGGRIVGGKLEYVRPIKRNKKTFKIVDYVKINGARFKVTSIGKKAFKKCKKIKKVKIRSKRLLKFSKSSFKGIPKKVNRKLKLVVRKKYKKKYKKLLKKKGLSRKVRV